MRVAAVTNCQAFGLADSIGSVGVDTSCDAFTQPELEQDPTIKDRLRRDYDHVFASISVGPQLEGLLPRSAMTYVPIVNFMGFHPDIVYLQSGDANVVGPLGHYHSLIAFRAFREGMSEAEAAKLYDGRFFESVGYFDVWTQSRQVLFGRFEQTGLPLVDRFYAWVRKGVFMHTHNHPKIWVLADVARVALESIGVACHGGEPAIPDNLAEAVVVPVYPGLAERLGLRGSFDFKPSRKTRSWDLEELLHHSYESYRALPSDTSTAPAFRHREARVAAALEAGA